MSIGRRCLAAFLAGSGTLFAAGPGDLARAATPEGVVQRVLEAQVRGNIDAMMREAATGMFEPQQTARAQQLLKTVASKLSFSGLKFQVVATGRDTTGNYALVRYRHSCTIATGGEQFVQSGGSMALLVRTADGWKLYSIVPDELLTLEVFDESAPKAEQAGLGGRHSAVLSRTVADRPGLLLVQHRSTPRSPGLVDAKRLSSLVNRSIKSFHVDEGKAARDAFYSAWGTVPIVGDVVSSGYTIYERIRTVTVELPDNARAGNLQAVLMDIGITAWGVVQCLAEPIPVLDTATDKVELLLDQMKYNMTQRHNYLLLYRKVLTADYRNDPKYLFLRPAHRQLLREGQDSALASMRHEGWHGRWPALKRLTVLSDHLLRADFPVVFDVGTELRVRKSESETVFKIASKLGARTEHVPPFDDEVACLPVRLTDHAARDASTGAAVLRNFRLKGAPYVAYDITCTRGTQQLTVEMADGSKTEPVEVENLVFNAVTDIEIELPGGRRAGELKMMTGDQITGARLVPVMAPHPHHQIVPPELTGLPCANRQLVGGKLLALAQTGEWPAATLTLEGRERGIGAIELELPGDGTMKLLRGVPFEITGPRKAATTEWVLTRIGRTERYAKDGAEACGDALTPMGTDLKHRGSWSGTRKIRDASGQHVDAPYQVNTAAAWNPPAVMTAGETVTIGFGGSVGSTGPDLCGNVVAVLPDWKPGPKPTPQPGAFDFSPPSQITKSVKLENGGSGSENVSLLVPESSAGACVRMQFSMYVAPCGATSMTDADNLEILRVFEYTSRDAK